LVVFFRVELARDAVFLTGCLVGVAVRCAAETAGFFLLALTVAFDLGLVVVVGFAVFGRVFELFEVATASLLTAVSFAGARTCLIALVCSASVIRNS
jgi:hypothetical protein